VSCSPVNLVTLVNGYLVKNPLALLTEETGSVARWFGATKLVLTVESEWCGCRKLQVRSSACLAKRFSDTWDSRM